MGAEVFRYYHLWSPTLRPNESSSALAERTTRRITLVHNAPTEYWDGERWQPIAQFFPFQGLDEDWQTIPDQRVAAASPTGWDPYDNSWGTHQPRHRDEARAKRASHKAKHRR